MAVCVIPALFFFRIVSNLPVVLSRGHLYRLVMDDVDAGAALRIFER